MSAAPMSAYDADYDAPEVARKGVSAEQQALVLACDLTDAEKAKVLDALSERASGDYFWPHTGGDYSWPYIKEAFAEEMANLYGLAEGSDGLWHDAMVLADPERPENGYEFDPSSVR